MNESYLSTYALRLSLGIKGNGKDCFRTYELLLSGIIPILKERPENYKLFKDLPVIQLPHWDYSQTELLKIMQSYVQSPAFRNNTFEAGWKRLFLSYFRHQVIEDAGRLNDIITDNQGNEYFRTWQYTLFRKPHIQHAIES